MSADLPPTTVTRLEKAAADNGFDRELARQGGVFRRAEPAAKS